MQTVERRSEERSRDLIFEEGCREENGPGMGRKMGEMVGRRCGDKLPLITWRLWDLIKGLCLIFDSCLIFCFI